MVRVVFSWSPVRSTGRTPRPARAGLDAVLPQQLGVSRKDALPLHLRAHAAAGEHFERLRRGQYRAGLVKGDDSGLRQPFQRVALADEEAVRCTVYPYGYPLPRKNLPSDRKRLPLGPRGAKRAALRLEGRPWGYFLQRQRKVTIWARVQGASGEKVVAVVPEVMFF